MRPTKLFLLAALAVLGAALVLGAGAALAATIDCPIEDCDGTNQNDVMRGSASPNKIYGYGGADLIYGLGGDDS